MQYALKVQSGAEKPGLSAYHSRSEFYLADPTGNFQNRKLAELDPSLVLAGEAPRLLDEWQEVPSLWDAVRFAVDLSKEKRKIYSNRFCNPES